MKSKKSETRRFRVMSKDNAEIKKVYFRNGVVGSRTPYVDGVVHGIQRLYHRNGSMHVKTKFINGKKVGKEKYFDEDGKFEFEFHYN